VTSRLHDREARLDPFADHQQITRCCEPHRVGPSIIFCGSTEILGHFPWEFEATLEKVIAFELETGFPEDQVRRNADEEHGGSERSVTKTEA